MLNTTVPRVYFFFVIMHYANLMKMCQFLSLLIAMDGSRGKASIRNI